MSEQFYFDIREGRNKPIPRCSEAHPDLYWNERTQRCELIGMPVDEYEFESYEGQSGLGFLPAAVPAAAAAGPAAPIVLAIAGIASAIGSIFGFGGGAQRGADERTSGEYLTAADQSKNTILLAYQQGKITKQQAADLFEREVIGGFVSKINSLKTESVRESRTTNQVNDLRKLFYNDLETLPLFFAPSGDDGGSSGVDPFDLAGGLIDIFGNPIGGSSGGNAGGSFEPVSNETEIVGDDGSYYYENRQTGEWFYSDAEGNQYGGSGQGDSYAIESDGYYEVDTAGNYYYEAPSGEWYYEDSRGQWSSGDSMGYGCNGDAAGNWSCSDGSRGSSDTLNAKDRQNRQRAPQKRSTPQQKKATGVQKATQLATQGIKILQGARQAAQGSNAQARRIASTGTAINSAGARNPNVRAITGANANANGGGAGISTNTLLIGGLVLGAFLIFSRR